METTKHDVKSGRAFGMFMNIRSMELKNVRSAEFTEREMVSRITNYIKAEANRDAERREE